MSERSRGVQLNITREQVRAIITRDDPKSLVEHAERIGQALSGSLSKSQIRSIFGAVRRIQLKWRGEEQRATCYRQLLMLKPKLRYQAARHAPVRPLAEVLEWAIDEVGDNRENFLRFADFFEAILAYHREKGEGTR